MMSTTAAARRLLLGTAAAGSRPAAKKILFGIRTCRPAAPAASHLIFRNFGTSSNKKADGPSSKRSAGTSAMFAGLLGAATATAGAVASLEEEPKGGKYRTLPKQKYPSPPPIPKHGSEFHHSDFNNPPPRPDLPTITLEELSLHNEEDDMWFSFRGAVYDMSFFKYGHPGGTPRLLMGAGQDLEPYWEVYRQHFRGHIVKWMEQYRVANLSPDDAKEAANFQFGDMYETDPIRDENLLPCTQKPFNGEPRLDLLTRDYITPNELFYTRNHLAIPDIDPDEYVFTIKGKGIKSHKFTLDDLKRLFPKHEVVTTLQCAGNRREDLHSDERKLYLAPHWVSGAMSTAKWGGIKIRDVLRYCGLDVDALALGEKELGDHQHLQFLGYDTDETGFCYGSSVPMDQLVDPLADCIFAFEMNDEPLPRDHGFPMRAIIPGNTGNCQCKWLRKAILSDKESSKPWQAKSYRGFAPDVRFEGETGLSHWPPPRLDQAPIVYSMPVQSLVCNPPQNSILGAKTATDITLKGVAWSGGGRKIERVDVSIDGGKHFTAAELYKPIEQRRNRHWAWTQFSKTIPLPEDIKNRLKDGETVKLDIVSKAMNSNFDVQPERSEPYWNARGVCINHWYHVNATLDPSIDKDKTILDTSNYEFANTPSGGKFKQPWDQHGWTTEPTHSSDPRPNPAPESKHF